MELIRRVRVTKDDDKGSVEVSRTVYFELVSESIPLKLIAIALQKQNVQT